MQNVILRFFSTLQVNYAFYNTTLCFSTANLGPALQPPHNTADVFPLTLTKRQEQSHALILACEYSKSLEIKDGEKTTTTKVQLNRLEETLLCKSQLNWI